MVWNENDGRQTYVMERWPELYSVNERSGPALPLADLHSSGGRCEKAYQIHEISSIYFRAEKNLETFFATYFQREQDGAVNFDLLLYFDEKMLNISVCRLNL